VALRLFGLTGGIGSGKSTVARRLRERGVPVIDADQLAREVVAKGTPGLSEIVARFGEGVLDENGELDRKRLAALVFKDDEARRALNAITHPRVAALAAERAAELDARGEPLACYEVPLLFEGRLDGVLKPVVVVAAPVETQVARAVARDGGTPEDALARVRAQMPLEEKIRRADHVIDNSGPVSATLARADEVLDALCTELGVDPARYPRPAHSPG
jgi:dephospho-CoA kinase